MSKKMIVLVFGLGLFLVPQKVSAATYYASPNGSGTCTDTSPCSFDNGYKKLGNGDTLYLRKGTYTQQLSLNRSGTSAAPLTVAANPGDAVLVKPSSSGAYDPALSISGDYNVVQNLEATNPSGKGVQISGSYNKVNNINLHDFQTSGLNIDGTGNSFTNSSISETQYQAVNINGPDNTMEGNDIFHDVRDNDCASGGGRCNGDNTGTVSINGNQGGSVYGTIIRGNNVHETYGEAILCMSCDNALVEGNRVWDNLQESIYFDHSYNSIIRGNLVYYTTNKEYWTSSDHPQTGIEFANESGQSGTTGHDLKIYNNIIINTGWGITSNSTGGSGMKIVNNTVINNNGGYNIELDPSGAAAGSSVVENNIFLGGTVGAYDGYTYDKNLVSNVQLVNSGASVDGQVDPGWYKLTANSPAKDAGLDLKSMGVTTDFAGNTRPQGSAYDVGAFEYVTGGTNPTLTPIPPSPTRTPTPTPTVTPKPTPTKTPTPTITPNPTPVPVPGDANVDGKVDGVDYMIWLNNYNLRTTLGPKAGDFNSDGITDGVDYTIWLNNYSR